MERTCKKCGNTKPIDKFSKNKNCINGITSECLECKNKKQNIFRKQNRNYVNDQAKKYQYKKHPERLKLKELKQNGFKKCSKCKNIFEFKEFNKGRSICYKCRTGHNRGIFINKTDNGRYIKLFSNEEIKKKHTEYAYNWAKLNPEKRKLIDKKSKSRPEYKEKDRIWKRKRYYAGLDKESRLRYQNSIKGKMSSKKAKIKYAKNNPDKMLIRSQKFVKELYPCYIINKMKRSTGLSAIVIRKYPELIEAKQIQIKLKRLANEKCN